MTDDELMTAANDEEADYCFHVDLNSRLRITIDVFVKQEKAVVTELHYSNDHASVDGDNVVFSKMHVIEHSFSA